MKLKKELILKVEQQESEKKELLNEIERLKALACPEREELDNLKNQIERLKKEQQNNDAG